MTLQFRLRMPARFNRSRPLICSVGPRRNVRLTQQSERTGIENKWFALTSRVVAVKAETDGDPHTGLSLHGDLIIALKVFRSSTGSTTVPAGSDKYKIFLAI